MKKLITVVGARPQFIKCSPVSGELRKHFEEIIIHTGQHYDERMSDYFFNEMEIPKPEYNLLIGEGSQNYQTAKIIIGLEEIYAREKPVCVVVYGDTTTTFAAALSAVKMDIPVAHIEAGLRSYNRRMPEEINRVLTDNISDYLFAPIQRAVKILENEKVGGRIFNFGDVMYDALINFEKIAGIKSNILKDLKLNPGEFYFVTLHRPYNVDDPKIFGNIIKAFKELDETIVFPVHPRTRKMLEQIDAKISSKVKLIEPVGYLDSIILQKNSKKVITDSGGIQKEAYFLNIPCVTLRSETEWIETVECGANLLVESRSTEDIVKTVNAGQSWEPEDIFGDGKASKKIAEYLKTELYNQ